MKYDGRELGTARRAYDVCIIGSGPAGMTTALELKSSGLTICVLEAGDDSPLLDWQYPPIECGDIQIRPDSRERALGGTSTTWAGLMAPLDAIDFEPRPGIHDGWPVSRDEIQKYIDQRGPRYMLPGGEAFRYPEPCTAGRGHFPEMPQLRKKVFLAQNSPLRYGKAFADAFLAQGFDLYLRANVRRLECRVPGEAAVAEVEDSTGRRHLVQAHCFVLAASTIENVRLLLSSNLGNEHDQVGRYFMNHPKGYIASVSFKPPVASTSELFEHRQGDFTGYIGFRLSETVQRSENLLNASIRFDPGSHRDYPRGKALGKTLHRLIRGIAAGNARSVVRSATRAVRALNGASELAALAVEKMLARRTEVVSKATMRCFLEMEPQAENRIVLGRDGTVRIHQSISPKAYASVRRLLELTATAFASQGLGTVELVGKGLEGTLVEDASHHLGGARMGEDPKSSVVDPSLRVHTTSNVFVAGGAVFPTSGSANPTMTIIALSIRLADHIRQRLRSSLAA